MPFERIDQLVTTHGFSFQAWDDRKKIAMPRFVPIQVLRRLHGRRFDELTAPEKALVDAASQKPPFGRKYSVGLWDGCVEVVTVDESARLFIERRERGMVHGRGGWFPLPCVQTASL